jgi:hypothetical protein
MEMFFDWKFSKDEMPEPEKEIVCFSGGAMIFGKYVGLLELIEGNGMAHAFIARKMRIGQRKKLIFDDTSTYVVSPDVGFYWDFPSLSFNMPNELKRKVLIEKI